MGIRAASQPFPAESCSTRRLITRFKPYTAHLLSTTTATLNPTAAHQAECQWPPSTSTPGNILWSHIAFKITLISTQRHLTLATISTLLPLGGGQEQSALKHAAE